MQKLTIFDLDRTLVPFDSQELYPKAVELLQKAAAEGHVAIATNQGGPACRDAGWGDHFPSSDEVLYRIMDILDKVEGITGQCVRCEICWLYKSKDGKTLLLPDHVQLRDMKAWEQRRKPNPGMLELLMAHHGVTAENTTMVGDSDDDEGAARAAGVTFIRVNFEPVGETNG